MNNFLYDFVDIIKNCNYDNTYKMAWAKSLVELAMLSDETSLEDEVTITLETISECFLKYYYNHTVFFNLIQGSTLNKPPVFKSYARELIEHYNLLTHKTQPIRFERAYVKLKDSNLYKNIVKKSVRLLKQDVSYRFLRLNGKTLDHLYQYQKGDDFLILDKNNFLLLKTNAYMLLDVINYRWSLILETFNSSPRIAKKVKILDDEKIQRKSLNKYFKFISLDNPNQLCFVCDKPTVNDLEIDHVIPWSYMYSDDLWNLVFVHKSCNIHKTNRIPNEDLIVKLENRNRMLIKALENNNIYSKDYKELMLAEEENLVKKFWIGCQ